MHKELEALGGVETPTLEQLWDKVKTMFTVSYYNEIEAYMADCVDHADVERKLNALIRRGQL